MTRIATLQRQARELGRLRAGWSEPSKNGRNRPVKSSNWLITSHAEHYIRAAADLFGGRPERWQPQGSGAEQWRVVTDTSALDAILPSGDPLSQAYELWSGGGCQRRCDGEQESLSEQPCMCRAQFGDGWWEQQKGVVCAATSRLNVILPDMPDFGVFRAETHSFYAANEIAATVDMIHSMTNGATMVPITLRIEQRTSVSTDRGTGKVLTKQYPVIAVELRGHTTAQLLSGNIQPAAALPSGPTSTAPAIESGAPITPGPSETDTLDQAASATTEGELRAIWEQSSRSDRVSAAIKLARTTLAASLDVDALWALIVKRVPPEWTQTEIEENFAAIAKVDAGDADAEAMHRYLGAITQAEEGENR